MHAYVPQSESIISYSSSEKTKDTACTYVTLKHGNCPRLRLERQTESITVFEKPSKVHLTKYHVQNTIAKCRRRSYFLCVHQWTLGMYSDYWSKNVKIWKENSKRIGSSRDQATPLTGIMLSVFSTLVTSLRELSRFISKLLHGEADTW